VIVTGARGGIGRAITDALGDGGATVAACDVAGSGAAHEFDVRDREAVVAGVQDAVEALGGACDAVIANAGVVDTIHRAERFSAEDWQLDLQVNLTGAFNVIQAAFEALKASAWRPLQRRDAGDDRDPEGPSDAGGVAPATGARDPAAAVRGAGGARRRGVVPALARGGVSQRSGAAGRRGVRSLPGSDDRVSLLTVAGGRGV
jgi:NAD(P)-dependent dehydrogenase (short-subunit alcohol dehydrogenase family)